MTFKPLPEASSNLQDNEETQIPNVAKFLTWSDWEIMKVDEFTWK